MITYTKTVQECREFTFTYKEHGLTLYMSSGISPWINLEDPPVTLMTIHNSIPFKEVNLVWRLVVDKKGKPYVITRGRLRDRYSTGTYSGTVSFTPYVKMNLKPLKYQELS